MNLIDRDALVKILDIVEDCENCKYSYGPFCKKGDEFVVACEAIFDAPVIEQPEVIYCCECKWYGRADKRRFYRGMDCLQHRIDTIVPDKDFCSRAERRTDG